MRITTPKVTDLRPTWTPFRGWTILFDNSDNEHGPIPALLDTPLELPGNRAYSTLETLARRIATHVPDAPIAWLPASSFHVTIMDGLSAPHVEQMAPGQRRVELVAGLDALPASLDGPTRLTAGHDIEPVIEAGCAPIRFELDAVRCRGHAVVAELRVEPSSVAALTRLTEVRHQSLGELGAMVGLDLVTDWRPHVTLGYVANRDAAAAYTFPIEHISALTTETLDRQSTSIAFHGAGLYGFTDMATYWRLSSGPNSRSENCGGATVTEPDTGRRSVPGC